MQRSSGETSSSMRKGSVIRFGYVRLLDAAPIIMAEKLGYFEELGLKVQLEKQVGWATIRDRITFGELDVAQALGPMPIAMRLGLGVASSEVVAGMILNSNGNAITLSERLWESGAVDGSSLKRFVRSNNQSRKLILGTVSKTSSHYNLLCRWLSKIGLDPHHDVIITVLPPEQMVRNLRAGNLDGFCVGEPWNSIAVEEGIGWVPVTSAELVPGYPEKVLMTQKRFESYRPEEYGALISALLKSCDYCNDAGNAWKIAETLSQEKFLNCSEEILLKGLTENFEKGHGLEVKKGSFIRFATVETAELAISRGMELYEDLERFYPDFPIVESKMTLVESIFGERSMVGTSS